MAKRVATCEGASTDSDIADLPGIPFHPPVTYTFPKREFDKKHVKCSCQRSWFTKWKWLVFGSCLRRCHVFGFRQVVTEFSGIDGNRRILLY